MEKLGLKIEEDYVNFVYSYVIKTKGLDLNYGIKRLSYLLKTNPSFFQDTISFMEYKSVQMEDFIIEDLIEKVDMINASKEELDTVEFVIEITKEDVDYVYESVERRFKEYLPFIFEDHIKFALISNAKALMSVKARELKKDDFFQGSIMANIQHQLVGRQAPAPCANGRVKREYSSLYADLPKR